MKLHTASVRSYRSIRDTGSFEVEREKTIFVGPNEAGKTVLLKALQQINPPPGVPTFNPLRDYPRALYQDIATKKVDPTQTTIVRAVFRLEDSDREALPERFRQCEYYERGRRLDGKWWHSITDGPDIPKYKDVEKDLKRLAAHVDERSNAKAAADTETAQQTPPEKAIELPSSKLAAVTKDFATDATISGARAAAIQQWLESVLTLVDEASEAEEKRFDDLMSKVALDTERTAALNALSKRTPVFVYFNNYFRVRPRIHLGHLADRSESGVLDDEEFDYGNLCLLRLLGFTARELSELGRAAEPSADDPDALKSYMEQIDNRAYQLNAASVRLTEEIRKIWQPDPSKPEANTLRVIADGQYLKVVVVDDLGVEVELDQRSEGFQWLVSFFVVFFAEAVDKHANAILLLDEPGMSLHGLKQREFRSTITRLAEKNQTLYTTHSPFLVGPDELDLVRVVEMPDRTTGTKVHTTVTAKDFSALLPLQEALGYDLAQSLFSQQRNLVLEGLTDYWYVDATAELMRAAGNLSVNEKIALVPASSAGKVVYYATILYAQKLKVAALLDSDTAGESAAQQDTLVHTLGHKRIIRTKDAYTGPVQKPEVEDLLRETLVTIAKDDLGWDVSSTASTQVNRPIVDIFASEISNFSKYKLAKAYLRWARLHEAVDLTEVEREQWNSLFSKINSGLS